ncbi:MAG: nucleoside/nucleotide kinase family protein [Nocardioidaceae bacterium]
MTPDLAELGRRVLALGQGAEPGRRAIVGIAGPPGAGKSTLAAAILEEAHGVRPGSVAVVGMDAFHLAHTVLVDAGIADVKGAPETFDVRGYVALLTRLRTETSSTVWCPEFRREIEDAVAGASAVGPEVAVVVTEGNYLLLDRPGWRDVRPLLDECWYVDTAQRQERLAARHRAYGRGVDEAWARTNGSDEANARLVTPTRDRADLMIDLSDLDSPRGSALVAPPTRARTRSPRRC